MKNQPKIDQKSTKNRSKIHEKSILEVSWGLLGGLERLGGLLGGSWGPLGRVLGPLGRVLGRLGGFLGSSWGPPGGLLGASWARLGASWGPGGGSRGGQTESQNTKILRI